MLELFCEMGINDSSKVKEFHLCSVLKGKRPLGLNDKCHYVLKQKCFCTQLKGTCLTGPADLEV